MVRENKIKYQALLIALFIIAGVGSIFFLQVSNFIDLRLESQLENNDEVTKKLFAKVLKDQTFYYETCLNKILIEQSVKEAFSNRNRERLFQEVFPKFEQLQKENPYIKIFTFRLPDGSTFLRVHKPEMYGDKLNKKRKIIIDTNRIKQRHYGFEVGKLKMTYRIVIPMFYQGEHLGLVEFGIEPGTFMQVLDAVIPLKHALVIKKDMQEVMLNKKDKMLHHQEYALAEDKPFFNDIFKKLPIADNIYMRKNSRDYAVNTHFTLQNHSGDVAAFYLSAIDITKEIEDANQLKNTLIFLVIISIILLMLLLNYSINYYIKTIKKMVYVDELTQLPNRFALLEQLKKTPKPHCMFLIDINEFKVINELYGVKNGNIVLKEFGNILFEIDTDEDLHVYRISSDEFIILLYSPTINLQSYYDEFAKKIHKKVQECPIALHNLDVKINIEITIGAVCGDAISLEKADMALMKARKEFEPYLFYSQDIDTKQDTKKIIQIKKDIRYALENDNITPFFQPIVNASGEIIKYEALVRLIKLDAGKQEVLSPVYFLELSQKFNLYTTLSKIVISKSIAVAQHTNKEISINLSPSDIQSKMMREYIFEMLSTCKKTDQIVFEITENEQIEDFTLVKEFIQEIQKMGAKIAIDDFGSGYANYSHIFELKPNYIKIDGSLIKNIVENVESQAFVKAIVMLSKELNIKTIAEFVHSKEVFELARSYGVDEFQGYYFGAPQSEL